MHLNQLKAGVILSYASFGVANLIALVYTPFMLRMMGQEEYGLYSLVASVISYLTVLDFGFGNAIVRYTTKYKTEERVEELPQLYGMFTVLYCLMGIIATAIGVIIFFNIDVLFGTSMTLEEIHKLRIMMALMVFNLAFTFAMSIWRCIPVAYERFVFTNGLNLVRMLLNPVLMVVLLLLGYKAIALVVVITSLNILTIIIDYFYCKKNLKIKIKFDKSQKHLLREVFTYSFWIFLGVVVERLYWSSGQFILGIYAGSAAVGIFAVAVQLAIFYTGISSALPSVLLPRLTRISYSEEGERNTSDFYIRVSRIQFLILFIVFAVFTVFGKNFIILWAGADYVDVFFMAWLFLLALLLPGAQATASVVAQAKNSVRPYALIRLTSSLLGLIASMFFSHYYGYYGCAMAISIALILQTFALNIYYKKELKLDIKQFFYEIAKMSWIPSVVCFVSWCFLRNHIVTSLWLFILEIGVYLVILLVICWFTSLNDNEKNLILIPLRKMLIRKNNISKV